MAEIQSILIAGPPKTRKTSAALSVPGRKVLFDFDHGAERAYRYDDLISSGELEVIPVKVPISASNLGAISFNGSVPNYSDIESIVSSRSRKLEGYCEAWDVFVNKLVEVITNRRHDVLIIDTGSLLYEYGTNAYLQTLQEQQIASAVRDDKTGELKEWVSSSSGSKLVPLRLRERLQPFEYPKIWDRLDLIMQAPKDQGMKLVVVCHTRPERRRIDRGGTPTFEETGNLEPDAYKYQEARTDITIITDTTTDGRFIGRISRSGVFGLSPGDVIEPVTYDALTTYVDKFRRIMSK